MRYLLAVDPGIRGCGVAFFDAGQLHAATYVRNPCKAGAGPLECVAMGRAVRDWEPVKSAIERGISPEIVCEWPQIYRLSKLKGDPNDLPPLAAVDAAIFALCFPNIGSRHYSPHEWKGTLDTENVIAPRVQSRLTAAELANVSGSKSLLHNVWDAVGLGLKHLGKFEPRRVIER